MSDTALYGFAVIVSVSITAQWLAWRLRWPAIVLLLLGGFFVGPITHWVDPDKLFGDLLFPIVSISVAIILFEGGLTLRWSQMRQLDVVRRLVTVGVLISWCGASLAAWWIVGLSGPLSILLGAILVVTGPTVIMPLLRQLRLKGHIGPILKWEGILNDPIGAVLAVLVFEALLSGADGGATRVALTGLGRAIGVGVAGGLLGAAILVPLIRWYWLPDDLHAPAALALVVGIFTAANAVQHESGLLAVTLMGAALANQKWADIQPILDFKENLRIFLIGVLFIVLAARVPLESIQALGIESMIFVAVLVGVVRPAAVLASTLRSQLTWRERAYLALIAPRGIVAAAVTSAFAIQLGAKHIDGAEKIVPLMFLVIIGTIGFSGLLAHRLAKWLDVADLRPSGYLILGAHRLARDVSRILAERDVKVLMIDNNWNNVHAARMQGLPVHRGNILSPNIADEISLQGIGRLLALSASDEANSLAAMRFAGIFGRENIFQLVPEAVDAQDLHHPSSPRHVGGRYLFDGESTYGRLMARLYHGQHIKSTRLTDQFDFNAFVDKHGREALPLFYEEPDGDVVPFVAEQDAAPEVGHRLISLVREDEHQQAEAR